MQCNMCGSEEDLFRAKIEGTELNVCKKCAGFGKILGPVVKDKIEDKKYFKEKPEEPEVIEMVIPTYPKIIKRAREKLNLNQKEFAMKLNEKESIIHKIENGSFEPPLNMARKLESLLNVNLIEEYSATNTNKEAKTDEGVLTIGDMIKIKRR